MEELLSVLKALSDKNRLQMVKMLLKQDLCVGALAKRLGISRAAASQHLQLLRKASLVRGEKRGYFTHYGVNKEVLERIGLTFLEMSASQERHKPGCIRSCGEEGNILESEDSEFCRDCERGYTGGK